MDNITKCIGDKGVETLVKTILTNMATEGYLPYLKKMITTEVGRATTVEGKINDDFSALVDMMGLLEDEINKVTIDNMPVDIVECLIVNSDTFEITSYPAGYDKTNTIVIANKAVRKDGIINDIAIQLTYNDSTIGGKTTVYNLNNVEKLYVYLKKTNPIFV